MDFSKVKLIVSDMDGTLLNSKGQVSPQFFQLFKKLQKHNIHFVAASGRQYNSIVSKLSSIQNNIFVIAENGAIAKKNDTILLENAIPAKKVIDIIPTLRKIQDTNIILCAHDAAFIESKNEKFISLFQEYYHNFHIVDDLIETAKTTTILKIANHHFKSSEEFIYPSIKHLKTPILLKISGQNWLDISDQKANKGNALREVQQILKITKEETMVFGDYHNDLEMLHEANFSFAMKNAHKDILKVANYSTESNDNFGVERVLEKLIEAKRN
ncbi:HAD family hydrolase [Polaribacter sp. MSW13]|uniref:HAD family hydrolase n=1 Tax=Polaribacter marinus TaxID=2916838 RepID=A0A9X1VLR5_9FLAO|nr:HAD family hydrolase [Polaribacter marinus]